MKKFFSVKRLLILFVFLSLVGAGGYFYTTKSEVIDGIEVQTVTRGEVKEIISETGHVQPSRKVTLAFERSGKVTTIPVNEGDLVNEGDILIELDQSERRAELSAAYARLRAEQVRLSELISGADNLSLGVTGSAVTASETTVENAKINLKKTIEQQDLLVDNAKRTLITSGLEAYLVGGSREDSPYSYTPPTITGVYNGAEEGVYTVSLYRSGSESGSSFKLTGMETDTRSISTSNPVPLGTRGLFIQFPTNFANGSNVIWEVPVPNTRSSSYLSNLNAYNAALEAREIAIKTAENAVKSAEAALSQSNQQYIQVSSSARDERVEAQRALVSQMGAAVTAADIELEKMTLRAPFTGVITDINVETGEIVGASAPAVSIISDENFELVVNISESDIQELGINDTANVLFDAYDDLIFKAHVNRIAPVAKMVDGVRVFEVTLQFDDKDELIRSGLSADIDILSAERSDVIVVPTRAVVDRVDGKFVRKLNNESIEYIPVTVGLRGSDGMTEIISGLTEGEEVITFASSDVLEKLEVN